MRKKIMGKYTGKRRFAWVLVLAMMIQLIAAVPLVTGAEAVPAPLADRQASGSVIDAIVKNAIVIVKQGDRIIGEGSPIIAGEGDISIEVRFNVPVLGDWTDPENQPDDDEYISKGDVIVFDLTDAFDFLETETISMYRTGPDAIKVADVTFEKGTSKAVVVFNGDDLVFNGDYNTVSCSFKVSMRYDESWGDGEGSADRVVILGKEYEFVNPKTEIHYELVKSGKVNYDEKCIEWSVRIKSGDGSELPLAGLEFTDDLNGVGPYIDGSFEVNGVSKTPTDTSGNVLRYTFPDGADSNTETTITFKTGLDDDTIFSQGEQQTFTNTAQLMEGDRELTQGEGSVTVAPKWIEKQGVDTQNGADEYDPQNRFVKWTVTANQEEVTLMNARIIDILEEGLTFISATLDIWDGSDWVQISLDSDNTWISQNGGEVTFRLPSPLTKMVKLTILTKLPEAEYGVGKETWHNEVTLMWDEGPGTGIGSGVDATVGYNAIYKEGNLSMEGVPTVEWTIEVMPKGHKIQNMKVYDLVVHGTEKVTLANLRFESGKEPAEWADVQAELIPRYGQKLVYSAAVGGEVAIKEITPAGSLTIIGYKLFNSAGDHVADLLVATDNNPIPLPTVYRFRFDTQLTDPKIFADNKPNGSQVVNTASLFSGNRKINEANGKVSVVGKMLEKSAMLREADIPNGAAANTGGTNSYDYLDNSAVFRLDVNKNRLDFSDTDTGVVDGNGVTAGVVELIDRLPAGWNVKSFSGSEAYYKIYEYFNGSYTEITDSLDVLTQEPVLGMDTDGKCVTVTFQFIALNKNYVVFIKAGPTEDEIKNYFEEGKKIEITNEAEIRYSNWVNIIPRSDEKVVVVSEILSKGLQYSKEKPGVLTWQVDYKPKTMGVGDYIVDILPEGVELRMDANGQILLEKDGERYIYVRPLTLNSDGSYSVSGDPIPLVVGQEIRYNNTTRELTFTFPDMNQAYRWSFLTDITGDPNSKIKNTVTLYGGKKEETAESGQYIISSLDANATMKQAGSVRILKTSADGSKLGEAVFVLLAQDGKTVIRYGRTDVNGVLVFRGLPVGEYTLKEIAAPPGHTLQPVEYQVSVRENGGYIVTYIDGGRYQDGFPVVNYRGGELGNLKISKMVAGDQGQQDRDRVFIFRVWFFESAEANAPELTDTFEYSGFGVAKGKIKSGGTVELKHGESVTIIGIPKGTAYAVKEVLTQGQENGYTTTVTDGDKKVVDGVDSNGTIVADEMSEANYLNFRLEEEEEGGNNEGDGDGDEEGGGEDEKEDGSEDEDTNDEGGGEDGGNNGDSGSGHKGESGGGSGAKEIRPLDPNPEEQGGNQIVAKPESNDRNRPDNNTQMDDDDIPLGDNTTKHQGDDVLLDIGREDEYLTAGDNQIADGGSLLPKTGDSMSLVPAIAAACLLLSAMAFLIVAKPVRVRVARVRRRSSR